MGRHRSFSRARQGITPGGEYADFNGGFVLPCAIERRVAAAVGRGTGGFYFADFGESRPLTVDREGSSSWADYPRGVA